MTNGRTLTTTDYPQDVYCPECSDEVRSHVRAFRHDGCWGTRCSGLQAPGKCTLTADEIMEAVDPRWMEMADAKRRYDPMLVETLATEAFVERYLPKEGGDRDALRARFVELGERDKETFRRHARGMLLGLDARGFYVAQRRKWA